MEMFHWLVFAAIAAVVFSLVSGILAMIRHSDDDSASWMGSRVGFQALACSLVIAAAYADS